MATKTGLYIVGFPKKQSKASFLVQMIREGGPVQAQRKVISDGEQPEHSILIISLLQGRYRKNSTDSMTHRSVNSRLSGE